MKLQLLLCPFHHQVKPWRVLVQRENMLTLVLKLPKAKAWTSQVQRREMKIREAPPQKPQKGEGVAQNSQL